MTEVVTARFAVPAPVMDDGVNTPLAPAGNPLTLKLTTPVNPFALVTVRPNPVFSPGLMVCDAGLAVMLKSPAGVTTRVMETV